MIQGNSRLLRWFLAIDVPDYLPGVDRDGFRQCLREGGIQTSVHYPPLHRFSHTLGLFRDVRLPVVEQIEKRLVTLPMGPTLTEEQIGWIVEGVARVFE